MEGVEVERTRAARKRVVIYRGGALGLVYGLWKTKGEQLDSYFACKFPVNSSWAPTTVFLLYIFSVCFFFFKTK